MLLSQGSASTQARPDPDDQERTADEQRGHLRTSHVVIGGFVSGMDGSYMWRFAGSGGSKDGGQE
jgi:hypothetical protein